MKREWELEAEQNYRGAVCVHGSRTTWDHLHLLGRRGTGHFSWVSFHSLASKIPSCYSIAQWHSRQQAKYLIFKSLSKIPRASYSLIAFKVFLLNILTLDYIIFYGTYNYPVLFYYTCFLARPEPSDYHAPSYSQKYILNMLK